ncbi:TlpA family protein disulfide reductase [Marinagarivorans algicola]|uniref:TlpA family protein disulfide reductase n=1 Tax=Marinagarivorans algicola TaxID=1513270 RepID=UPI0006B93406|nr:TlpA disulfide reductase family protein [Marinagarivorans algicola]
MPKLTSTLKNSHYTDRAWGTQTCKLGANLRYKRYCQNLVATIGLVLLLGLSMAGAAEPTLKKGDQTPNWMLRDTTGEWLWLYKVLPQYDATILFFWASWCEQCRGLLPKLQQLQNDNANIKVLALNVWETQDPTAYLDSLGISLTLLPKAESVAQRYQMAGTPSIVVINNQRQVLYVEQGANKDSKLLQALSPFITPKNHTQQTSSSSPQAPTRPAPAGKT